jgi:hypothetical protein
MNMTKRLVLMGIAVCGLALLSAPRAKADALAFECTGSTTCTSGSVTQLSNLGTQTFDFIYHSNSGTLDGQGELAVIVPNDTGNLTLTVTVDGAPITGEAENPTSWNYANGPNKLGSVLTDEDFGTHSYTFSSIQSASAQIGVTANSFKIYEFELGNFNSSGQGAAGISNISVSGAPIGSVIVGWVEDDTLITPLSGSVTVPEPSTSALFGLGLIALLLYAGVVRQRAA